MTHRPRTRRLGAVLAVSLGLAAVTAVPAGATSVPAPRDRSPHFAPLAISVASFIGQNLAAGVLSKVGGTAFGAVLSEAGFGDPAAQTLAELKAVSEKLDRVQVSIDDLKNQVASISASLANQRLNALRQSANILVGHIDAALVLLKNLSSGQYSGDPTLRAEKRQELLTLIGTKIKDEQSFLNDLMLSPRSTDDIVHTAWAAERTGRRFWTDTDGRDAAKVLSFYQDESAIVLMLRAEYEWSTVQQNSTPAYQDGKRAEVKRIIDAQTAQNVRLAAATPRLLGSYSDVIDTRTRIIWSAPRDGIYQQDWLSNITMYNTLPSVAQFRALVAGRTSNQTPPDYLRSQGWVIPTSCDRDSRDYRQKTFKATETVFWTSDFSGAKRTAWAMHDDGTGSLATACVMTIREIPASDRYWY